MLRLLLLVATLSIGLHGVASQSDASCLPFYDWTFNSQKKSPCEVASSLIAACNNGPFPVDALPDMSHYNGPSLQTATPCQCNTVAYSLMSACGACQGRTYLSWSVWSASCATVIINAYPEPIPSGVAVPGWAYLDVKATDNFDQSNARQNANITESTAIPSPTSIATISSKAHSTASTLSSLVVSSSVSPAATTPSNTSSSANTSSSRANTVGGGVVGGLLGGILIIGLLYWYFRRRNRARRNGEILASPVDAENPPLHGTTPYMHQTSMGAPQASVGHSAISSLAIPAMNTASHSIISGSTEAVASNHT